MSHGKSVLAEALITILCAALMLPSVSRAQKQKGATQDRLQVSTAMVNRMADRLASELTRRQYDVARGYVKLYTQEDCATSYKIMKSCYANNPAAPYILPVVPSWPEEYFDPNT